MVDVAKKKLPMPVVMILLYVSYCAMSWFTMRGVLAYSAIDISMPKWLDNDVFAFFVGGLVPFAVYSLLGLFVFKTLPMATRGGNIESLRYGLNLTVIAANVLLFALKFMYIAIPLAAPIVEIIIDPVVTICFVALYMWYAFYMEYVKKCYYRIALTQVFGLFLAVYGLLALVSIIIAVV